MKSDQCLRLFSSRRQPPLLVNCFAFSYGRTYRWTEAWTDEQMERRAVGYMNNATNNIFMVSIKDKQIQKTVEMRGSRTQFIKHSRKFLVEGFYSFTVRTCSHALRLSVCLSPSVSPRLSLPVSLSLSLSVSLSLSLS